MLTLVAKVAIKASGERYDVYRVPGDHGEDYAVWVSTTTGWPCRCNCKSRQFRGDKLCKHMVKMKQYLDEQRRTAPLYRQAFSMTR